MGKEKIQKNDQGKKISLAEKRKMSSMTVCISHKNEEGVTWQTFKKHSRMQSTSTDIILTLAQISGAIAGIIRRVRGRKYRNNDAQAVTGGGEKLNAQGLKTT